MCQRLPIDETNCIFYSRLSYSNSFLLFLFSTLLNSSFSLKSVFLVIFLSEKHEVPPAFAIEMFQETPNETLNCNFKPL